MAGTVGMADPLKSYSSGYRKVFMETVLELYAAQEGILLGDALQQAISCGYPIHASKDCSFFQGGPRLTESAAWAMLTVGPRYLVILIPEIP
jgi:hypothetical protein